MTMVSYQNPGPRHIMILFTFHYFHIGTNTPPTHGQTGTYPGGPMDADPYRDTLPRDPYADESPYGRAPLPQHLDDRNRQTPSPAGGKVALC